MKIPDCDRCYYYSHLPYFVCAVHPDGAKEEMCLDFRSETTLEEEIWSPDGYTYYNGELIPNVPSLTRQQQEAILNFHPLFTNTCPSCGHKYRRYREQGSELRG